jgi:hypothetical protein
LDFKIYPNDNPDKAAKKIHKDFGSFSIGDYKRKKPRVCYKYSKDIPLAEEIELDGQNVFLQINDGEPVVSREIDLGDGKNTVIRPHPTGMVLPIIPYAFNDMNEIGRFIERAKEETLHSLLSKSKSLWKHFVITKDNDTIILLAVDQVYSYFQDLFATTHYDIVTGSPGSGKGAILGTMKALGYRTVLASDMSGANLLDISGSDEPCQVTIAEDEFDDIDRDEIKKKMYKVGYDINGVVPRTLDGNTSARSNRYYFAYSFKIFAAENPPESKSLAGLNDRMFRIESIKSRPKFLIKTILDQMRKSVAKQNPKYKDLISKINYLRKLLLVYRLLHHGDIIDEVPLNIDGRALELTGPQIYLFASDKLAGSNNDKPALNELLRVLSRFLHKKGEIAKKTIDGTVHDVLEALFPTIKAETLMDVNGRSMTAYTISNEKICDEVRAKMDGVPSTIQNEYAFYSTDYGKVTHKRILKICRDRFSGEPTSIGTGNEKVRALTFDKEIVEKIGKTFEIISDIKIIQESASDEGEDDIDKWAIPFSSQDRPPEKTENQNHQNIEDGTMGRKNGISGGEKDLDNRERFLGFMSKREEVSKQVKDDDNLLSPRNGPISVPTSQPVSEGSSDADKAARLRLYEELSKKSRKASKAPTKIGQVEV